MRWTTWKILSGKYKYWIGSNLIIDGLHCLNCNDENMVSHT